MKSSGRLYHLCIRICCRSVVILCLLPLTWSPSNARQRNKFCLQAYSRSYNLLAHSRRCIAGDAGDCPHNLAQDGQTHTLPPISTWFGWAAIPVIEVSDDG